MQKIIIDTNVMVSALIQRSYPYLIVKEIFTNKDFQLCISDELYLEYFIVLNGEKFPKFPDFIVNANSILIDIEKNAVKYYPTIHLDIIGDKDDNKLLELAETCHADILITGNSNDFTFAEYKLTKIVSPKAYWVEYSIK